MFEAGTLPLLQDDRRTRVWTRWNATYRDVHVVDRENFRVGVFNLTQNDLGEPENYAALKAMLIEAGDD
ncbi:MAG: hypothetical protein VX265_18835 [Myxococcota bacterium]|nr:hypothetical protein [Myxococcota bacterium]